MVESVVEGVGEAVVESVVESVGEVVERGVVRSEVKEIEKVSETELGDSSSVSEKVVEESLLVETAEEV